jgi:hypothetical protein
MHAMSARLLSAVAVVACALSSAAPASAELVYLQTGRSFSVRAVRSEGDLLILQLRGGGEMTCSRELIARVAPDEVEYPEDVLPGMVAAQDGSEPPAIPDRYEDLVVTTARKHGVDARLVHAVIQVESAYRARAISPKGARGLMQLLPSTGRQYGAMDLFDPEVNLDAGVRHLKGLLARFDDLPLALAAYNAGAGAVSRFGGIPPFRETRTYVTRILQLLDRS